MNSHPANQPMEKYSYGFKREPYCSCNPPCGDWLLYRNTIDMDGKEWTTLGEYYPSKESILEYIVENNLPTEWAPYVPFRGAQANLGI